MTTSFTLRDFLVYLLTGTLLIISLGIIYSEELLEYCVDLSSKYKFLDNFGFLTTIFLIPFIYLLGQIIGSINFFLLKTYVIIHPFLIPRSNRIFSIKGIILKCTQIILYRHRIVYRVILFQKEANKKNKKLSVNGFWEKCAVLQVNKIYSPAEYWYILNELFSSLNVVFLIATVNAIIREEWKLAIIFTLLTLVAYRRAMQYSEHFVETVMRLTKAHSKSMRKSPKKTHS